jgi:hypothetical protein
VETFLQFVKLVATLLAAIMLGNWYLSDVRKARRAGKSWYAAHLSPPGLLILLAMALPVILYLWLR